MDNPEMRAASLLMRAWSILGRDTCEDHPEMVAELANQENTQAPSQEPSQAEFPGTPAKSTRKRGKKVARAAVETVENLEATMAPDCATLAVVVPPSKIMDSDAQSLVAVAPDASEAKVVKAKPLTPHQAMMNALAMAIHGTIEGVTEWGRITTASKKLRDGGYAPEDVALVRAWLQAPRPVGKAWPQEYITAQSLTREAATWHGMGRPQGDQLKPGNMRLGPAPQGKAHNTHDATAKVVESAQSTADYLRSMAK